MEATLRSHEWRVWVPLVHRAVIGEESAPHALGRGSVAVVEASRKLFESAVVERAHGEEGDVHWTQFDDARAKVE